MPWSHASPEFTHNPTHSSHSRYVPPQYRNNNIPTSFPFSHDSTRCAFNRSASRTRGRGGSTARRFSRPEQPRHNDISYWNGRCPFDEAEVAGQVQSGDAINFDAYESVPVEASGKNVPPPVNAFDETDLDEGLKRNIERCKYVKPTPVQRHAIPIAIAGRDLMACAQTGSGKTAAFCFPIISGILKGRSGSGFSAMPRGGLVAYPTALILSPTRELSCQIRDEANKFAYQTGVKVVVAYGGASITQQLRHLEKGVDILVATPGRLVDIIERERVSLKRIKYLALDEADRMLDMGFEHQIRKIVEQMHMPPPGVRQTMLFSATFPNDIQKLASDFLSNYIFLAVGRVGSSTELIEQRIELVQDTEKRNHLVDILRSQKAHGANGKHSLTLVFVETKKGADALENWLSRCGFPATTIHGDKVQMERERALRSFKSGSTPILVATDVASRGLDIPHVAHVINFDLPRDIDDYVHRIGRTGRAGKSGLATAFFSSKNTPLAKALVGLLQEANQEVPSWFSQYTESSFFSGRSHGPRRYNSGNYGGRDFRNVTEPEVESYNYSTCDNADSAVDSYLDGVKNSHTDSSLDNITNTASECSYQHTNDNSDFYGGGKVEDGPCGYTSIVATGWE
ncbi:DEAD-box ATP-dependent RNA helicase 52-like [Abrus precatorius]|uniref:RNA helicase n=1 Tax=Abrus precatorius TaxID=3816 RepID=A0A8B8JJG3_ABRPR|nr:DEAD-box ATP-dependent RNA helicase 52-like [Abrus precatorius]